MRQGPGVLLLLIMGILLCVIAGAVADERPRVQPIISADSHRHQAEGCESTHDGEKDLNALLTHHAYGREREMLNITACPSIFPPI